MNIHGDTGDGEFGQLSSTQLQEWVAAKIAKSSGRNVKPSSISQCCNDIMSHGGAGGGGTRYTWKGKTVYHTSHGQMGSDSGCTVFFADMGGSNGTIVAIGWHHTNTSYELDWVKSNWHSGRILNL